MSTERIRHHLTKKRIILVVSGTLVMAIVIVIMLSLLAWPTRSVVAFCSAYKQENLRLANSHGDTYSVKPFTNSSNNPRDFVTALDKLEQVAPEDIQPDVKTLKQIFEKIDQDPSQALTASLSGLGAEDGVSKWTSQHCQ